jgi:ketosteroid isomerase-like protein
MTSELPGIIAEYFEADRGKDAEAIARCFADGAVVRDEGHVYTGLDAIRRWKAESSIRYSYTVEPLAIAANGARTVVTSRLAGTFPGSPVDLRYFFALAGERITELEIVP